MAATVPPEGDEDMRLFPAGNEQARLQAMYLLFRRVFCRIRTNVVAGDGWQVTCGVSGVTINGEITINPKLLSERPGQPPSKEDVEVFNMMLAADTLLSRAFAVFEKNNGCIGATLRIIHVSPGPETPQ